jgi:hypothetical protein
VFVGDEVLLEISFKAAQAQVADLSRSGSLVTAAKDSYGEGITSLVGGWPADSAGASRLTGVYIREPRVCEDAAVFALRWEAIGPEGRLFPALDADITLTPVGDQATLLTLSGAYRMPSGLSGSEDDQEIVHRLAGATIRSFIKRVADEIGKAQ